MSDRQVPEVVRAHLDAFNARDHEAVLATFGDDAVFSSADGLVIGRRALAVLFAEAFAVEARAVLELRSAVVQGETSACELVERITVGETVHELDVAVFYTVRDGLLARVRVYREAPE